MFFVIAFLVVCAAVMVLCSKYFWYLVAAGIGFVFLAAHAQWIAWGIEIAVPAALIYGIAKIMQKVRDHRSVPSELPAATTSYETSPAYVPSGHARQLG